MWINDQIKANPEDKWWHGVDLVVNQWLNGLVDGYNAQKPNNQRSYMDFYLLNS